MTAIATHSPVITVDGSPLASRWLDAVLSVRIERGFGLVGRSVLRFSDEGYGLSTTAVFDLGTTVKISDHERSALMSGTVTGVSLQQSVNEQPELVVVVHDAAFKLARGTRVTTYLNATYSDIISQLAQAAGLTPDVISTSGVNEYLLQAGTDLAFLNSIMERIGYVWWLEDDKRLTVKPAGASTATVDMKLGDELTEFNVRASGLRPTEVRVSGWDRDHQQNILGSHATSQSGKAPAFASKYATATTAIGTAPASAADWSPADASEASVIAQAQSDEWSAAAVVARGTCLINSKLKPAVTIKVSQAGPASGEYLISEVEHVYGSSGFYTRFTAGPLRSSGLVDTLGPGQPDPGFAMPGLVIATITNVNDPDAAGRAKVTYAGIDGQIESPWARIVTLGAGAQRGVLFQPEVGDEVLVAFERGDTRRPVVLGGLFSQKNTLPTTGVEQDKVKYRRLTSRLGHIVELADGVDDGTKHILLKLGTAEHRLRLGSDRFDIELAAGKPLTIKAGSAKFDINSSGDVTIEGNNVTIKATQALKLEGTSEATLKGTAKAAVQGMQVEVKGDATTSVEASGQLSLKGGMVAIN
ncbi:MAG TPA: phage baseplate assembly protein V [Jatrophihabitans sp.]|jgi:uncharacterized protein involved in type VI secretion and phage assembly